MSEEETTEPDITHDKVIDFQMGRIAEERRIASASGENRKVIQSFLEETGLNSQAVSWSKTILKKLDKDAGEAKAMDIIRSLKKLLPMVEDHVKGQQSTMDLPEPEPADEKPAGKVVGFS